MLVPDLKLITFRRFTFNLLQVPKWMDPRDFVVLFAKVFTRTNLLSIPSENLIVTALTRLFRMKEILDGSPNYPTIFELFKIITVMAHEKEFGPRYRDIFDAILNRLSAYLLRNFSVRNGIDVDVFTRIHIVLELPLIKIADYVHNFIASWIMMLIFYKNMTLGLRGNSLRTLYLVDEARTILGAGANAGVLEGAEPSINEIITKGREFGQALWLCSQESQSFPQVYRSNCSLKFAFALSDGEDIREIQKSFALSDDHVSHLSKLPAERVAICRYGNFGRPFLVCVPEFNMGPFPDDETLEKAMDKFYSEIIPKEDTPIMLNGGRLDRTEKKQSPAEIDAEIMIKHLNNSPFLSYRVLINELHLTPSRGDQARAYLVKSGLVEVHSIVLRKGKPGEYFELTEKARLQYGGKPPVGKGGFTHKVFAGAIKDYAEANGFNARIEGVMRDTGKAIDVLAWKKGEGMIGYEVTLHFENLVSNLMQDLATTLKTVVVVCRNKDELRKAIAIVREKSMPTERLEFKTIFDFTQKRED